MRRVSDKPVVLLGGDKESTRIVYHALRRDFPRLCVILEPPARRLGVMRGRRRRLGTLAALGQAAFAGLVVPLLRLKARGRIREIIRANGLDVSEIPEPAVRVNSVNSDECRLCLRRLDPAVVVVNGTRIIEPATLSAVPAPFINMHAGITPLYRGGHGAYWAVAEGRPEFAGTTIHIVDEGVDTGPVITQARFEVSFEDCFVTYPYLHMAAGLPFLKEAVRSALAGELSPMPNPPAMASKLRYHPTVWGYLSRRIMGGVR